MTSDQVVARLRTLGNPGALAEMARYGITTDQALPCRCHTLGTWLAKLDETTCWPATCGTPAPTMLES